MKRTKSLTALLMAVLMLFALCGSAFASGEASGEASAAVSITGTDVAVDEEYFSGQATETIVSDFTITADNENVTGISVNGESADDTITIRNGRIELVESGTVDITDGSLYAEYCLFQMKGYSSTDTDGCQANLVVDGTELTVDETSTITGAVTVDGVEIDVTSGTYEGNIVVTPN
ncbi:MAG: hypothetical protein LUC89_09030 [Oscillospiraceae bacterium]|nr:hypothetical protein [Oscillospiraceae bacterium]